MLFMPIKKNKFEPLKIQIDNPLEEEGLIEVISQNRVELHKKIVDGIEYCIANRLGKLSHAEGYFNKTLVVIVSIKSDDFNFHLDTSLRVLEELEEYEYCARVLKLKEALIDFKPKVPRKPKEKKTLQSVIKSL